MDNEIKYYIGQYQMIEKMTEKLKNQDKEIERLNNIINGYENMKKELLEYIYHNEYCRFGHIDGGEAEEMREIISKTDKLKALKEDDDDGQ